MGKENNPPDHVFFQPNELRFFDQINSEVPRLTAPRARYFAKVLQPVTTEGRFERDVLYGEAKRNWKFVGPIKLPIIIETPTEPKEFEENRGGMKDLSATVYISRKNFEDAIPEEIANLIIAARGAIIPEAGDIVAIWTTHEGDVAFWDVESVERDQYLGDLPLHLQWRLSLQRRTRYEAERAFGQEFLEAEPIVIIDAEQFEFRDRNEGKVRPQGPFEGKIDPKNPP